MNTDAEWRAVEEFLKECSPQERDNVIERPLEEWYHCCGMLETPRDSGNYCLVRAARPSLDGCYRALLHRPVAAKAYDMLCMQAPRNEVVPRIKAIAARLNGCSPEQIKALLQSASVDAILESI